jgi:hypothetical protein
LDIENADKACKALAAAYGYATVSQLTAGALGDGEAMSGILVAVQRDNGEATFLVFLLN